MKVRGRRDSRRSGGERTTEAWGPDPDERVPAVVVTLDVEDVASFVPRVRSIGASLGVPVQALRADRVASPHQLLMARGHARRAIADGRARTQDVTLEFLLYVAADRQINRAIAAHGVSPGSRVEVLLVALGDVALDALSAAVERAFHVPARRWTGGSEAAWSWWCDRLSLAAGSPPRAVEEAVFGAMAGLAVTRL